MLCITLGNNAPIEVHKLDPDPDAPRHPHARGTLHEDWNGRGPHLVHPIDVTTAQTEIHVHPDVSIARAVRDIVHAWDYHSTAAPGWVLVEDDGGDPKRAALLAALLEDEFGIAQPAGPTMLVTNAGLDYAAKQLGGSASATAIAKYVAVTANATAPGATDTVLTGEITTAGGGLLRAAGTYAHTTGASTYTVSITLTANGSDSLPVTLAKAGIFETAVSGGSLVFEDLISPTVTLSASGDAITLTETVTV